MYTWYPFSNLTPADSNSLQAWPYGDLVTGDKAIGEIEAGTVAMFKYDSTSAATEDIPNIITSDGNGGNGRWIRMDVDIHDQFYNGTFVETFNALVTSDGATITMALEQSGGGDLTCQFSSGHATHAAGNIVLTAGASDAAPQVNYIYILESDPTTLVKSTTQWPATEHIKVGYFLVPTAVYVASDGVYINQNWNDHLLGTDNMGHLAHICETIRLTMNGAHWHDGVAPNGDASTYLVTTGTPDEVYFKATAGVGYQLHKHTIPAINMQTGDPCHVVNWNADAYHAVSDLASIIADSQNNTLNNKYYNLVFWGTANKTGEYSPLMCNLPSGSYNTLPAAIADSGSYDVTTIPSAFTEDSATGFLICRLTLKKAGDVFTLHDTVDLRGVESGASGGVSGLGGGGGLVNFPDNTFTLYDSDDVTRILDFDLSSITTANTRTISPADADMTIPSTAEKTGYDSHVAAANPHSGHVDTTGNESISGVKTFGSFPVTPSAAPTTDYQVANKKFVEDYHDANVDLNANDREVYREILEGSAFRKVTWADCSDLVTFGSFAGATTTDGEKWTFAAADVWTGTSLDESTWATTITKAMLVIDYSGSGTFELSADGGANWEVVTPNTVHEFTDTGADLRLRITNVSNLIVYSYGVLYDIDTAALGTQTETTYINRGAPRNLMINGDMKIAQRGTSFAGLGNGDAGTFTLDRWKYHEQGTTVGVVTVSQDSIADSEFSHSMKIDCTTAEDLSAAAAYASIVQLIEGINSRHLKFGDSDAKDTTLSFMFKSDTKTGNLGGYIYAYAGVRVFPFMVNVPNNDWNKYSVVIPGDTAGTAVVGDSSPQFQIVFVLSAGANHVGATAETWQAFSGTRVPTGSDNFLDHTDNNLYLTGVQLELGGVANDYEHIDFADQLARCQRYFYSIDESIVESAQIGVGFCNAVNVAFCGVEFPVSMRTTPSLVAGGAAADFGISIAGGFESATDLPVLGLGDIKRCLLSLAEGTSSLTAGEGCAVFMGTGLNGWLFFDAET